MKKQILTLAMCLALTATSALAEGTKTVVQKPVIQAKSVSVVNGTMIAKLAEQPKIMTKEDVKKHFEEKRAKDRVLMYDALGLSAEQRMRAEVLDVKTRVAVEPLIRNVHIEIKRLRELRAKNASHFSIWQQKHAVKASKKEVENYFESSKKDFESILTKEQKAKFKLIDEAKRKEMNQFRKGHKFGGPNEMKFNNSKRPGSRHMGPPPGDFGPEGPRGPEPIGPPSPPPEGRDKN